MKSLVALLVAFANFLLGGNSFPVVDFEITDVLIMSAEENALVDEKYQQINAYIKFAELHPDNTAANIAIAQSYYELGEYENAVKYLSLSIEENDGNVLYLIMRGVSYYYLDDFSNAVNDLELARKNLQMSRMKYDKKSYYENVITIYTLLGSSYEYLGQMKNANENYAACIQAFEESSSIEHSSLRLEYVVFCYERLGLIQEAEQVQILINRVSGK